MGDEDLASGTEYLTDHISMAALELEAEFDQDKSPVQSNIGPASYSPGCRTVGRPDLLAQGERRQILAPSGSLDQLIESSAVEVQLPGDGGIAVQAGEEQVRSGDNGPNPFLIQACQRVQGFGDIDCPIIDAWNQMTVQVDNGEMVVGGAGHRASLRQRSGQLQGGKTEKAGRAVRRGGVRVMPEVCSLTYQPVAGDTVEHRPPYARLSGICHPRDDSPRARVPVDQPGPGIPQLSRARSAERCSGPRHPR